LKKEAMLGLLVAIGGGVLLVILIVMYVLSRIKVAGPNEAFIVTGRKGRSIEGADGTMATDLSGQKVVMGASVFVMPVVQKLQVMGLSSRRIHVEIQGAVSKQGIRSNLQGVAIVKVGGTEDAIRAAAQRFLQPAERDRGVHPRGARRCPAFDRRPAHRSRRSSGTAPRSPRPSRRRPSTR
jgi:flotillin